MPSNNEPPKPTKGWTPERRAAQAERARQQKPWLHSTGPRTEEGKSRSALNATTHGATSAPMDALRTALYDQYQSLLHSLNNPSKRQ